MQPARTEIVSRSMTYLRVMCSTFGLEGSRRYRTLVALRQQPFELRNARTAVRARIQRFADLLDGDQLVAANRTQQRRAADGEARADDRARLERALGRAAREDREAIGIGEPRRAEQRREPVARRQRL